MSQKLKTMSVNTLLEEVSVCESMTTLIKLKKIAKEEVEGAHPDTKKVIERLISYKMRLMSNRLLKPSSFMPESHWDQVSNEAKVNFYDCAVHFFKGADISMIVEILESASPLGYYSNTKVESAVKALKLFQLQFEWHNIDIGSLIINGERAPLPTNIE